MKITHKKYDLTNLLNACCNQNERLKRIKAIYEDHDKAARRKVQECQLCYSSGKIGGCAITHSTCGLCSKEMCFGSTCIDTLCTDCAKAHRLCKHCGGDIDCKPRKKLDIKTT